MTDRPQFHVELARPTDDLAVVTLAGEVDLYTAPQFHEVLVRGIDEGGRPVIVDFSAVTFIDSTALGVLVAGSKRLRIDDGELLIVCGLGNVRRLLQIVGWRASSSFTRHSTRR